LAIHPAARDGRTVLPIKADFPHPGEAARVVREVIDAFGRLDVIVNNAGMIASTSKTEFPREVARDILDVNALVPAEILAAALPHLKPGAAIVNISSVNAVLPPRDASIYGVSKAASNNRKLDPRDGERIGAGGHLRECNRTRRDQQSGKPSVRCSNGAVCERDRFGTNWAARRHRQGGAVSGQ